MCARSHVEASRRLNYVYRSARSERRDLATMSLRPYSRSPEGVEGGPKKEMEREKTDRWREKGPMMVGSDHERENTARCCGGRAIATTNERPSSFPPKVAAAVVIIARGSITALDRAAARGEEKERERKRSALANSRRLSSATRGGLVQGGFLPPLAKHSHRLRDKNTS